MKNSWELFPELTEAVRKDHAGKSCRHHPFEHALMVAQYCLIIAEDEKAGQLAAIAGLIHNTDRLYPEMGKRELEVKLLDYLVRGQLATCMLADTIQEVIDAVLNHSKKNDPADSPVLICLQDADKLANISPFDIIARAARLFPDLALVNPKYILEIDPESTYKNPKTVFRDAIHSTLEWETWLRLPKAKALAAKYFEGLRSVQVLTSKQLVETGLNIY